MTKSTHHHSAAKRGPRAGAAHKAWAQERMNRGSSHEQRLRGLETLRMFVLLGAARATAKPRKALRRSKVAQAVAGALR